MKKLKRIEEVNEIRENIYLSPTKTCIINLWLLTANVKPQFVVNEKNVNLTVSNDTYLR